MSKLSVKFLKCISMLNQDIRYWAKQPGKQGEILSFYVKDGEEMCQSWKDVT